MSLRRIHIADHKGRESSVSFTSLRHQQNIDYFHEESLVMHTRLLSDSKATNIDNLINIYQDNLAEQIINEFGNCYRGKKIKYAILKGIFSIKIIAVE